MKMKRPSAATDEAPPGTGLRGGLKPFPEGVSVRRAGRCSERLLHRPGKRDNGESGSGEVGDSGGAGEGGELPFVRVRGDGNGRRSDRIGEEKRVQTHGDEQSRAPEQCGKIGCLVREEYPPAAFGEPDDRFRGSRISGTVEYRKDRRQPERRHRPPHRAGKDPERVRAIRRGGTHRNAEQPGAGGHPQVRKDGVPAQGRCRRQIHRRVGDKHRARTLRSVQDEKAQGFRVTQGQDVAFVQRLQHRPQGERGAERSQPDGKRQL